MHKIQIYIAGAFYKMSYTLILTLNKSSILPSFFSKSEFLLFSSADIFSIVRSDYKDKGKTNLGLVAKYYMSSHVSHYFSEKKGPANINSLE
jgi:hypothetical protein